MWELKSWYCYFYFWQNISSGLYLFQLKAEWTFILSTISEGILPTDPLGANALSPPGLRARGFLFGGDVKTIFLIDGFNFYHSIKYTSYKNKDGKITGKKLPNNLKWFDYVSYCKLFLRSSDNLSDIFYFTAYAVNRPDSFKRQQIYIPVLQDMGIKVV